MPGIVASLSTPLQPSVATFTSGVQTTFTVLGSSLTSGVGTPQLSSSSSSVSWSLSSFSVTNATTLSLTATPTVTESGYGDSIGDLTVTINPNSTNQSSASKTGITYKTS